MSSQQEVEIKTTEEEQKLDLQEEVPEDQVGIKESQDISFPAEAPESTGTEAED